MENFALIRSARLIEHLILLSGLRKRDDLLSSITLALSETTDVCQVEIFNLVQDGGQRYWLPLTQIVKGSTVRFLSDLLRMDLDAMLPDASNPERLLCLDRIMMVRTPANTLQPRHLTRFPMMLAAGATPWGVAELHSEHPLQESDITAATQLLTLHSNMLDLLDYSECDALTGLWNRKPFDDLFYKIMPSTESTEPPSEKDDLRTSVPESSFWLAMIDIDHFKQVNDTYGHLIGDEVLLLVARILKRSFRATDRVYRFGGEEFVVVLRCADHDAAVAAAERFRINMAEFDFPQAGHITASIGLTQILPGDLPSGACERADQAVYYAKHHGRNQVCSEADLVRLGLLKSDIKVGDVELF